jgi:hypothetical protein
MKGVSFVYRAEHVLQLGAVAAGAALGGAAASYFLDPELGYVRRARLRGELASRASAELWELNRTSARWACEGLDRLSAELRSRSGLLLSGPNRDRSSRRVTIQERYHPHPSQDGVVGRHIVDHGIVV